MCTLELAREEVRLARGGDSVLKFTTLSYRSAAGHTLVDRQIDRYKDR